MVDHYKGENHIAVVENAHNQEALCDKIFHQYLIFIYKRLFACDTDICIFTEQARSASVFCQGSSSFTTIRYSVPGLAFVIKLKLPLVIFVNYHCFMLFARKCF